MDNKQEFNESQYDELNETLNRIYPIRETLQKQLIVKYDDELLDKIVRLNAIIENAEILLKKGQKIKTYYNNIN